MIIFTNFSFVFFVLLQFAFYIIVVAFLKFRTCSLLWSCHLFIFLNFYRSIHICSLLWPCHFHLLICLTFKVLFILAPFSGLAICSFCELPKFCSYLLTFMALPFVLVVIQHTYPSAPNFPIVMSSEKRPIKYQRGGFIKF